MIKMDLNFVAIIVPNGSGKNHQWVLNPWGNFNEEQGICMILKCCLIDCKGKYVTTQKRNQAASWSCHDN